MNTSIIIWNYNQLEYTKQCIANIRLYTESSEYELIIVDDDSCDGSLDWLRDQPDLIMIANERHLGYPKSCNLGIQMASGDNILLLANDVSVSNGWLSNLLYCLYSSEEIGAVGPVADNRDYADIHNRPNPAAWEERLKLDGCCLLVRKTVIDSIGLLDEIFTPGNFVDDDYSFRIKKANYKLILCKDTLVQHAGEAHFMKEPDSSELFNKNRDSFVAKWGFDSLYSSGIRWDIINLIDSPRMHPLKVLEVGCACGATLLQIHNSYPRAKLFGIELNESAASIAKLFSDVIATDIEQAILPYPEEFFDLIIMADVLEHLTNPWRALEVIKAYLKPGGQILASIPNVMHFTVLRNLLQGNWTYEDAGILDRTHLRFFTLNEIKKMFSGAGYAVNSCQPTLIFETASDLQLIAALVGFFRNDQLAAQYRAYQYLVKAFKPVSALPVPRPKQLLNPNKICFITCVSDPNLYQKCLAHIRALDVPPGYEVELLSVEESNSLASAYNQAIGLSDAKYKVYLHEDVFIINKNFIVDILAVFSDPHIGMLGVVGSRQIPSNGIWWESQESYGKVYDSHSGTTGLIAFQEVTADYQEVQGVDGLIIITQYDLPWRADIFTGWHFYDLSQGMEFIRSALKVVVPRQHQPWCVHDSGVVHLGKAYDDYRRAFLKEYLGAQSMGDDS